MNGSDERAAKRVKVEDDDAPSASISAAGGQAAVASTSTAGAGAVKQEPLTSTSTNGTTAKKEEESEYDDNYGLYEDYAANAEAVPPSGDLYLDTVSDRVWSFEQRKTYANGLKLMCQSS